jgi:hypothetical protein
MDLERLRPVFEENGPFLTLHVDVGRARTGLPLPAPALDATELPADRVLVAAAALTGARVSVLPASVAHGGGASALLRWDDRPSRWRGLETGHRRAVADVSRGDLG